MIDQKDNEERRDTVPDVAPITERSPMPAIPIHPDDLAKFDEPISPRAIAQWRRDCGW